MYYYINTIFSTIIYVICITFYNNFYIPLYNRVYIQYFSPKKREIFFIDEDTYPLTLRNKISVISINLLIILPFYCMIWSIYNTSIYKESSLSLYNLLSLGLSLITTYIIFTAYHYILHKIEFLYRNIHYVNHRSYISSPIDVLYMHPVEYISNLVIINVIIYLYMDNIYTIYLYIFILININVYRHLTIKYFNTTNNIHHKLYYVNYDTYPYYIGKYILKNYKENKSFKE